MLRTNVKELKPLWGPMIVLGTSLAVLSAHAYIGSYSRFIADDYCSGANAKRLGVLRAAWFVYRTWNGRYSASLFDALFGYLGPRVTPLVTALVIISWFAALTGTIYFLLAGFSLTARALWSSALAGAILFLTLALAPNVAQALYWGQGMRSVLPPVILLTCYVLFFCLYGRRHWSLTPRILWMALSLVLIYGAGGFSETYTALQLTALLLAVALSFIYRKGVSAKNNMLFLCFGLLGAVLSFITVVAAPGNSFRQAFYPAPPSPLELLHISLTSFAIFFGQLFDSATKILALVGTTVMGVWAGAFLDPQPRRATRLLLAAGVGVILIFSCFPPAAYGQSDVPPDRTLIIPVYILTLALTLLGMSLGNLLPAHLKDPWPISRLAIVLILIVGTSSFYQLISSRHIYAAYAAAWGQFHAQMIGYQKAGVTSAEISTADMNANNWTRLNVLGDNPKFWLNKCVTEYYGVSVISNSP